MICPRCNTSLVISNTQGIEIDHCPNCRGAWLDRGELEKIVERSNSYGSSFMSESNHSDHHDNHYDNDYDHQYDNHQGYNQHSRRKKGFFSELFDF